MSQILANLDDINAHLDGSAATATDELTALNQVSVARVVRGYLSTTFLPETLAGWASPATTPEYIRDIAGRLIASQLYRSKTSSESTTVPKDSYAQVLYNEAMMMLEKVRSGTVDLPEVDEETPQGQLTTLDFWPNSDTDRAFTMGMLI